MEFIYFVFFIKPPSIRGWQCWTNTNNYANKIVRLIAKVYRVLVLLFLSVGIFFFCFFSIHIGQTSELMPHVFRAYTSRDSHTQTLGWIERENMSDSYAYRHRLANTQPDNFAHTRQRHSIPLSREFFHFVLTNNNNNKNSDEKTIHTINWLWHLVAVCVQDKRQLQCEYTHAA